MRRILQNRLLSIVIVLSIVFIVFIGLTASKRDNVSIFEGVVGNVLEPVQKYLYIGGQRINNFFSFVANISNISKEN
jgi:rod shape-determining protein MreC